MLIVVVGPAFGATHYWDNNGEAAGFGTAGGTWGAEPKWGVDRTGASVPAATATTDSDDLFFGTDANGLASGTILVDGTGQAFRSMTFGAASGAVTLSGGALNLAVPTSAVAVENASNTVASALAGAGGLRLDAFAPPMTWTNFLTTASAVVFTNATLADYSGVGGVMQGAWISLRPAGGFYFKNDGTNATCQLQALDDVYTKCVKVELTQTGADIAARAVYAKYVSGSQLGFDFDSGGNNGTVATAAASNGYGVVRTTLFAGAKVSEPFLTSAATTLFTNASLADCAGVTAVLGGGALSGGYAPARPYYFSNNGATSTVQIQAFNGSFTKCVKIELTQSGPDIAARVLYAKYYNSGNNNVTGMDFDSAGTAKSIVSSFAADGYGVYEISLASRRLLSLGGANTFTGDMVVDGGGTLKVDRFGRLGGGAYQGAIALSGGLLYDSVADQTLRGAISGAGALAMGDPVPRPFSSITHAGYLTTNATVILTDVALSAYTGARGVMAGGFVKGAPLTATAYHFDGDGTRATCQLQGIDDIYTKCVKVELTQVGADVAARALYAKYVGGFQLGYDFDSGGTPSAVATSASSDGYGVAQISLTTDRTSTLKLAGTNSYSCGTVVNFGVLEASSTAFALPSSGGVIVNGGAELRLNVAAMPFDSAGGVGNGNAITVNSGAKLTLAANFNAGFSRPLVINGGVLDCIAGVVSNGGNYACNLILQNGARVTGNALRIGYHAASTIAVGGGSPSTAAAGLCLVNGGGYALTLNVQDVTADTNADFTVAGDITDLPGYAGLPLVKSGSGTARFSGVNSHTGPITVLAGTLALGGNGALSTGNGVTLNGGVLDMGAFTNALGTLTVGTNSSSIVLGPGRLAFADSSGTAWSNTLAVAGLLGPETVRFGTSGSALSGSQISAIRINGERARLTPEGYLAPALKGTLISLH